LQQQAGLQKIRIFSLELFPRTAIPAFGDMLLNQRKVRDRDGFMIPVCFPKVPGVIADRAAHSR
jgi:hypothetical protein